MASIEKRETQEGKTSYRVKVRLKGYPTQSETFERLTDARKWASATESAIREGRHFKTAEAKKHTVNELIDRYTRDVLPTQQPKEQLKKATNFARWKEEIGHALLADLTPAAIVAVRDKLLSEKTVRGGQRQPATVTSYMNALSAALSLAVNEWGWLDDSPMRKVKKPSAPRGRVRYLSDDELARLLKACKESSNSMLYCVVVLAVSTGMRAGEIYGLYWKEPKDPPEYGAWGVVDMTACRIVLHETKNGERRVVPLVGHALECVRELAKIRRLDTDLLFPEKARPGQKPQKPIDLRTPWETVLKVAEIEDFHFHDLRHSAASYLAMNGATLAEIAETLGHKTLQMVKRYAHLSDAHVSGVVERMNQKIFGGV
jgi:integrase